MEGNFKQCPNGHYYLGDHCPYCKPSTSAVTKKKITVGSGLGNECIINEPDVEPKHCCIEQIDDEHLRITDLDSKSGTFVNGKKVEGSMEITTLDEVRVGEHVVAWAHQFAATDNVKPWGFTWPHDVMGIFLPPEEDDKKPTGGPVYCRIRKLVGWLVSYSLDKMGVDFPLYEGRNIIGRHESCNITVNDNMVSSIHAVLLFRAGKYSITDQQSVHGTFVNGKDIDLEACYLQDGDEIRVGDTVFLFRTSFKQI